MTPTNDPTAPRVVGARYWCMACPLTFADADAANAHHDATGHNQTHRPAVPVLRESGAGRGEARDLLRYEMTAQNTPPAPDLAKLQAELRSVWETVRQKERDAYQGANALDVQELDAFNTQLALENADLRARLAASSGESGAPTEELAGEAVMEAIELTIKAVDAQNKRGVPLAAQEIDYAGIQRLALLRSQNALASRLPRSPRAAGEPTPNTEADR